MKKFLVLILFVLGFSCSKSNSHLIVKANIDGLKKGTVYLKRIIDTLLVTVDSVQVNGNSKFELYSDLEEPDLFYIYLDKNSKEEDRIEFFADKGTVEISTTLKNFVGDAEIKGSEHQKIYEDYKKLMSRLNNRNLDLIKESFEAQKEGDSLKADSIAKLRQNIIKSGYLQTVNFALNHRDSEVAPFLALSEIYNAKVKWLDTINNSLTPEIKASKYGKRLQDFITEIKAKE
ncbi:DUF4369 domain-containing protein [Hyunsoonleella sp. SJ7]|uniref:DUF4369 domain-containing protein n=1 Tax=Hyunsoonleella aquatilis TaxID=2762758 RepID=A0A923HFI1_9FLAO|nr:DUF4369 domain-containing protein [Hyunsoonleella aquatilis]MBC3757502.1 DUF4369 domain-containing protein [Hyunsoonleella aquatilis]